MTKAPTKWTALASICILQFSLSTAVALAADSDTHQQNQPAAGQQAGVAGQQAGTTAAETGGTTSAKQNEVAAPPKQLNEELFSITPQFGFLNYFSAAQGLTARAVYGFTTDVNIAQNVNRYANGSTQGTDFFIGPTFGLLYAHLGNSTGDFWGDSSQTSAVSGDDAGANVAMIPVDLKVGYTWGVFRASVHAGGNVFYRTDTSAIAVNPDTSDSLTWSMQPNVGADLELAIPGGIAVLFRPDWTLGGSGRVVASTLGIMIPIS